MKLNSENPIPRGAAFHDHLANSWGDCYSLPIFRKRLELINSILDRSVAPGQHWLDLGCGSGVITTELIKRGVSVVALDGSPSMLQAARRTLNKYGSSVSFREGEVQDLSWCLPGAFDGVLCSSVIEYLDLEDANELIRQVSRVLKDDGLFVISMPQTKSLTRTWQKFMRTFFRLFGQDRYSYLDVSRFEIEPSLLVGWLEKANLRLIRITGFDTMLPTWLFKIFRPGLLICEAQKNNISESNQCKGSDNADPSTNGNFRLT
jgi:ubiquinone/menaquinone biosynthesis C-methylase UbiE